MLAIYTVLLWLLLPIVRVAAVFNRKLQRSVNGRKSLIVDAQNHYSSVPIRRARILIHVASYGELEQAKPVISEIKKRSPEAHVHLTFFSPSGYDNVIGKYSEADYISYAPIDLRNDVCKFLDIAKPDIALFARYDVWPNMSYELKARHIPAILFAATASQNSGRLLPVIKKLYLTVFHNLTKILVISDEDRKRFESIGVSPDTIVVAGDTRFDQVVARHNAAELMEDILLPEKVTEKITEQGALVFIAGSSWETDEAVYIDTLKKSIERGDNIVTIIAPHDPTEEQVRRLLARFSGNAIRYSQLRDWKEEPIIIVDSIGKLFSLYGKADIALIGGGFGAGLHNVLEAAVWGIPTLVGPKHKKSREVQSLVDRLASFEITTKSEFEFAFWQLAQSDDLRKTSGEQAMTFVHENCGATERILKEILLFLNKH